MNQNIQKYFFDEQTQQPRYGVIVVAFVVVLLLVMFIVNAVKNGWTPPPTDGEKNGDNKNDSPFSQPLEAKNVPPAAVDENLDSYAVNLQRVNSKTYWMLCSGSEEPNERCDWYKRFLQLSDASTKTVANIYAQKFSKKLYDDLAWACDCTNWSGSGTLAGDIKKKLENLGLK